MSDDLKTQLEKAKKEYDKVCERLEQLNEQAYNLEQEIMWIQREIRKNGREKLEDRMC